MFRVLKTGLASALLVAACSADVIYSKNGRSIEGVIQEETPEHVVLGIGAGTMTLRRTQILRIERASGQKNAELRDGWRRRYYLNDQYLPAGEKPLAAAFRKLQSVRLAAVRARRGLAGLAREENRLLDKVEKLERKRLSASRNLAAAKPRDDVAAYNALVATVNAVQADLTVSRTELRKLDERRNSAFESFARYLEQLSTFQGLYDERLRLHEQRPLDETRAFLFTELGKQVAAYEKEFRGSSVHVTRRGNSSIVRAIVNGKRTGSFVVDTGASLMTVSESFAAALGVQSAKLPKVDVVMADGRKVEARSMSLQSVRVGDAHVDNVRAVVLPETPAAGIDGLLGMAFLRHFSVHLDGATGKLHLKRFSPRQ